MDFEEVNLSGGLSVAELDALIGKRDYRLFLNPKNELFREMNMKHSPPPRQQALRLMAANPNLVRRPIFVSGRNVLPGFDAAAVEELLQ